MTRMAQKSGGGYCRRGGSAHFCGKRGAGAAAMRAEGPAYCFGLKPEALIDGFQSSESCFWMLMSSSGEVPVA